MKWCNHVEPGLALNGIGAVHRLVAVGAHLVLCAPSKLPIWSWWNKRSPSAETAVLHRAEHGPIGVVPFSLDSTAVDVDCGGPSEFFATYEPRAIIPSKRRGAPGRSETTTAARFLNGNPAALPKPSECQLPKPPGTGRSSCTAGLGIYRRAQSFILAGGCDPRPRRANRWIDGRH